MTSRRASSEVNENRPNTRPNSGNSTSMGKPSCVWFFPVFDQIAAMHKNPEGSPGRELAAGLQRLGLGTFVQDAWQWQHESLCEDFVRNFDHVKMKTSAFGTDVDLSFRTFVELTGLPADEGDEMYPEGEPCLPEFSLSWRKYFSNDAYDPRSKGFCLSKCKDSNLRFLIETLNDTAWMRRLPHKYKHAPKDLIYLMCQVEKNKKVNWGRTIHNKFVDELTRLYMVLFCNKREKSTTRAGPLMCFLFGQFMDPIRHHIEGSSGPPSCEHPANSDDGIYKECEVFRETDSLLTAGEKWDDEKESGSSWDEVFVSRDSSTCTGAIVPLECTPQIVGKKRSLPGTNALDDIARMVEMIPQRREERFAKLYLEEQKHAEECLKAKLAAEKIAETLRTELKGIKEQQTNGSMEEEFAKQQVVVLRHRLEKSILERDLARVENEYLKVQLKKLTSQVKIRDHCITDTGSGPLYLNQ